jgi:hypothetical protein
MSMTVPVPPSSQSFCATTTDLVPDPEDALGRRIIAEFGLMDLHPEPLRALAESDELEFREIPHNQRIALRIMHAVD